MSIMRIEGVKPITAKDLRELRTWCRAKGEYLHGSSSFEEVNKGKGMLEVADRLDRILSGEPPEERAAPIRKRTYTTGEAVALVWAVVAYAGIIVLGAWLAHVWGTIR